jgi:GNAT superfamily N-acetyltransferase
MALGFKSDEVRRTITFEDAGRPVRHELRGLEAGTARAESSPLPRRRATGGEPPAAQGEWQAAQGAPGAPAAAIPDRVAARTLELTLAEALGRSELTFPDLRRTAASRPLPEPLLATILTAAGGGAPAAEDGPGAVLLAAAVSVLRPGGGGAEVVSLVVRPEVRRRGLGTLLLAAVEGELARRGQPAVELAFRDTWSSADAVRGLLAARGWSEPRSQVLMVQTDTRMLALPWLAPRPLPAGYEVFPWGELAPEERRQIVRRQQRAPWYPEALSPFQLEDRLDLEVSVGLRHRSDAGSRVIGWLLGHRVKPDVVQYTSLFVEEGHGKLGRGLPLIAAVARRHEAAGVPRAIFMVQADNAAMRRLVERRLAPYLTERAELLRAAKLLRPAARTLAGQPVTR